VRRRKEVQLGGRLHKHMSASHLAAVSEPHNKDEEEHSKSWVAGKHAPSQHPAWSLTDYFKPVLTADSHPGTSQHSNE
jgi:hypothetical protein